MVAGGVCTLPSGAREIATVAVMHSLLMLGAFYRAVGLTLDDK